MRIVVPVSEDKGEESRVAYHFGRAPYFAIFDSKEDSLVIKQTRKEVSKGRSRLAMKIMEYNPDVVFAAGMGRRAVDFFRSNNIRIETGDYNTLKEIMENKDKLEELEEACKEARHG
ncbi:MAG: NifB/NifX family molybdenum-iron cluster-binding protein [Thermoproteota archaeon]